MSSTLAPIGFALPRLIRCNVCKGSGQGRATLCCDACGGLGGWQSVDWPLATLAHNLTIAAGLCESYQIAREVSFTYCEHWLPPDWHPGCGKAWEGR